MSDLPEFAMSKFSAHEDITEQNVANVVILKAGLIGKEGHLFKTWRSRWCILRSVLPNEVLQKGEDVGTTHVLVYYKLKHDAVRGGQPCGAHVIAKGKTETSRTTRAGRECLRIATPGFDKVYYIQPFADVEGWLQVLTDLDCPLESSSVHHMILATGDPPLAHAQKSAAASTSSPDTSMNRKGVSVEVLCSLLTAIHRGFPGVDGEIPTRCVVADIIVPATREAESSYIEKIGRANRSYAGTANVFVSHAWNCNAVHLLETLIDYSREQSKKVFFWLDICCCNQHVTTGDPPAIRRNADSMWWSESFTEVIQACGRVLVVAAPCIQRADEMPTASTFSPPAVCTRAWCLLEIATAMVENVDVDVRMPRDAVSPLENAMVHDTTAIVNCLTSINSETASATEQDDLISIWQVIETEFSQSYREVNACVRKALQRWIFHYGLQYMSSDAQTPIMQTKIAIQAGEILQATGDNVKAIEFYNKALAIQLRVLGMEHRDTFTTYTKLGSAYEKMGKNDRAIELFGKALAAHRTTEGRTHPDVATVCTLLGDVHQKKGGYEDAIALYGKALDLQLAAPGLGATHPDTATTYNGLGLAYKHNGNYEVALVNYNKALAIRRTALGDKHLATAATYNNIGGVHHMQNACDEAIGFYQKALDILLLHDGEDVVVETAHVNLGSVCQQKGDDCAAITHYERALAIAVKVHGSDHLQTAETYNHLGGAHHSKGDYIKAVECYHSSLAIMLNTLGTTHPNTALAYNNLGGSYHKNRNYDKAIDYYTRSLGIMVKALGSGHPVTATSYYNIASAHECKGDYDSALDFYSKCLSIMLAINGPDNANTASAFANLGSVYDKRGDFEKAVEYCTKAHDAFTNSLGADHPSTTHAEKELSRVRQSPGTA